MPSGIYPGNKGRKHSEETLKKMRGRVPFYKGKNLPDDVKKKISNSRKGKTAKEKHPMWIKDRSKLKKYTGSEERRSPMYKCWAKDVRDRDKYKCRLLNNKCSGRLEVHHIFGFTEYPELRYIINNGITLCHAHHPRGKAEEKRMIPIFQELLSVSKE